MARFSEHFATISPDGKRVLSLTYAYPPHELNNRQVSLSRQEYEFLHNLEVTDKSGVFLEQLLTDNNYKYQILESIRYKIGKLVNDSI